MTSPLAFAVALGVMGIGFFLLPPKAVPYLAVLLIVGALLVSGSAPIEEFRSQALGGKVS